MSHPSPSRSPRVIGRIQPAARPVTPRRPIGEAVARWIAVVSGTVLVATLGLLLASTLAG